MSIKHIHDVIRRSRGVLSKVNYRSYLTNKKEPVETISKTSSPSMDSQLEGTLNSAQQVRGIRKLAARLRLRSRD